MKERPILFSGAMVRSLLNCTKSQTRRVVKPQPLVHWVVPGEEACPYGQSGDRLWVRETWQGPLLDGDTMENEYRGSPDDFHKPEYCEYAADGGPTPEFINQDDELVCRWRPSIHMPRWASRIKLEITGVRVERLQDISEADAKAEGIASRTGEKTIYHYDFPKLPPTDAVSGWKSARSAYKELWCEINGRDSWESNPWVWVVEFKRVQP